MKNHYSHSTIERSSCWETEPIEIVSQNALVCRQLIKMSHLFVQSYIIDTFATAASLIE